MKRRNIMARLSLFVLVSCLVLVSVGCSSSPQTNEVREVGVKGSNARVYEVFGMNCPGCQSGLEKLVNKIPAVQNSQAHWKDKRLSVTIKPGLALNDEDVYDAIRRSNFTPGKRIK
jgi:hypothetical protein